jgi:hypothetical protein
MSKEDNYIIKGEYYKVTTGLNNKITSMTRTNVPLIKDISKSFRLFGINIFASYKRGGIGWFRLFGKGIHWKDTTKHSLLFSERNGYRKGLNIGLMRFKLLK